MTDLHSWITQQVDATEQLLTEGEWPPSQAEGVRLRCEADRRILARHQVWPGSDYCEGCDQDLTTRIGDCPELLDLAHAHGITDDILASLDRPEPPKPPRRRAHQLGLSDILRDPTDIPPALRGPNWKADR